LEEANIQNSVCLGRLPMLPSKAMLCAARRIQLFAGNLIEAPLPTEMDEPFATEPSLKLSNHREPIYD
jgi:hypothetical protein